MTYGELKQAIQDYTQYTETGFVSNLPLFIRLSEERILKNVQLSLFRKNVTANASASNKYLAAPSDFLAPYSLSYEVDGSKVFLEFKDVGFVQTYSPDGSAAAAPKYYAQFDVDYFIIGPSPNATYVMELHYLYRPQSLTLGAETGVSWISENAQMALLYGALIEANIYLKGEADIMQSYEKRFMEALTGIKLLGEAKETTDEYRLGQLIRARQ
tara:strand:+ start:1018 stop:1659 length:642 start_codon:yes stop_codon:yes gene_type:complete